MTFQIKPLTLSNTKQLLQIPSNADVEVTPYFIRFKTEGVTYELWQGENGEYILEEWCGESCQPVKTTVYDKDSTYRPYYISRVLVVDGVYV